ncbi:MAG TPA: hypothetical protein VGX51_06790 [Solirubrobacteraceae bacterium]|jgi:hypothetical protein|nr:hypothetical protein [Solirubrobacteraceae bacterium]
MLPVLALLALAGCGSSHTHVTTGTYAGEGGANAPYLDVGPLAYQVQLSRQLSPFDTEDSSYLAGLTAGQSLLTPAQEWLGVFLQVFNKTSIPHPAATALIISDTQGNLYTPVVPGATNEFAYRAGIVPAESRVPVLDSVAANGATQGALLLYKIRIESLQNRPLKITIVDPNNASKRATATLDV